MAYLKNLKKIGVNTTVLASSLSLIACGGGGGYYGNNNNSSNNNNGNNTGGNQSETDTTKVAQSLTVTLQDAEGKTLQTAQDNSQVKVAIKVLNADKGGIAGKDIRLSITDADKIGVESTSSKVTSDENGVATFTLNIPALQAATGKVQLTAVVDGTTISIPYTLNIQKASTITSDYNLSVAQGAVLNLPKGSADIAVQVTDTNGGVKPGQTVQLTLPAEMQGKFVIASGSSISTDAEGKATFKITANADLTTAEIAQIIATSQTLTFKLIDEHRAERQATAALTFNDISKTVSVLEVITPDTSIAAKAGTAKVRVFAKNSNGDILANTKVKLAVEAVAASYGVTLDKAEATTNAQGYAEFTLSSNATHPIALAQLGIQLTATYSENNQNIKGNATVQVVTADETVDNQEAIQRLEIASSYKVNAKNDDVTITVKAIDFTGFGAKKGKVTLSLNPEAQSNGVTFEGASTKDVGTNGIVTFKLKTNATTVKAVDALVKAGITATFTTDNNVTNKIDIAVEDEAVSEEKVRYLAFEPITQRFDYTKSQVIKVRVQAVGEGDSALKGESISLIRTGLTTQQLQDLGLTPKGSSTKQTDENGFAEFEFQYTFANTQEQKDLVLNPAGIRLLAKSTNDKTQILDLKFKEPSATTDVTLESLVIDTLGLATLAVNTPVTLNVIVKATGSDGQVYKNQKVGLGLNEAALQNGASIVGGASKTTDANGNASFQIQITAKNPTELENLVANGLTLAVKGAETDITALRKIELAKPAIVYQDLANLTFTKVDGTPLDTVSVLGGETRVKVVARDVANNAIPNTPIAIALSSLVSSRVSLSDVPTTTNSKGEAEFTVTVSEGKYDESLIKNGIIFAVVGTNLNNGDRLQQTSSIGISTPANALNPRLTADVNSVTAGQTVKVYASVKDEMGLNTAAGTPMRLSLNSQAVTAGVKLASEAVVVQANGSVAVDLIVPKGVSSATFSSIVVTGTIRDPRGVEISTNLTFTVQDAINPYHLTIDSNRVSLSSAGDTALVTVKLLDANQGGVANQPVALSIADPRAATSIKGSSQLITNEFGEAVFELSMKAIAGLVAPIPNIVLSATNTNENGVVVSQTSQLQVHTPTALAPQLDLKIKASKDKLHVRGDAVEVSVLVTDVNGSSQSGKAVTLTIPNYRNNGAYIRGASTIESDENGWAKFTVVVDEGLRGSGYTAAQFVSDDLNIEAVVKDAQNTERRQSYLMDIVSADVPVTQGAITVVMNPNKVGTDDSTGIYYNWNASVQVTDLDGRPVANQKVTMDIRATEFVRGQWVVLTDPVTNEKYWSQKHLNNPPAYSPLSCAVPTIDDPSTPYDDTKVTITDDVDSNGTSVKEALNVVRFIGASEANPYTATYTTDKEGKFDFELRYPKTYGGWLSVQVGASTSMSNYPLHGYRTVMLPTVANDFDKSNWAFTPSIDNQSPYGKKLSVCK
ncbi:hypothetical protein N5D44_02695 [Acinetobacter junii]|uniref:hypothetical protein n=1 Tax=Acinetobacter junii TaxID=40215 RepID=UPI002448E9BE|nr:hypothetical protein [Acinetobacter junii]MDH1857273.1 hypothetical protein [Acinetobacter junii]